MSLFYQRSAKKKDALTITNHLVTNRTAACVNVIPNLESVYKWENKLCQENKLLLMIKTTAKNEINVYEYLLDVQPYDTPEIISLPIQNGSQAFLNWISDSVKS